MTRSQRLSRLRIRLLFLRLWFRRCVVWFPSISPYYSSIGGSSVRYAFTIPSLQFCADKGTPGLYRLREIAPDRFYHSEYYRSYYRRTGLAEEIGFLIELDHGMMLVISLMRAGSSAPFSDRDFNKLRKVEPMVNAASMRHWQNPEFLRDHHKPLKPGRSCDECV